MATIIFRNVGKKGFLALWFWVCLCAFTVVVRSFLVGFASKAALTS